MIHFWVILILKDKVDSSQTPTHYFTTLAALDPTCAHAWFGTNASDGNLVLTQITGLRSVVIGGHTRSNATYSVTQSGKALGINEANITFTFGSDCHEYVTIASNSS